MTRAFAISASIFIGLHLPIVILRSRSISVMRSCAHMIVRWVSDLVRKRLRGAVTRHSRWHPDSVQAPPNLTERNGPVPATGWRSGGSRSLLNRVGPRFTNGPRKRPPASSRRPPRGECWRARAAWGASGASGRSPPHQVVRGCPLSQPRLAFARCPSLPSISRVRFRPGNGHADAWMRWTHPRGRRAVSVTCRAIPAEGSCPRWFWANQCGTRSRAVACRR